MSNTLYGHSAAWPIADSHPGANSPWHELNRLAERAGVSVEHLCQAVECATDFIPTGKSTFPFSSYNDDLAEVVQALADSDFDLETKVGIGPHQWHEGDHPRDDRGRFSNGSATVHERDEGASTSNPSLPWFSHTHELKELKRVHDIVQQLYPQLKSRWKEGLNIAPKDKLKANGSKSWECHISIAQELVAEPVKKLCTQIHESLHAVSPTTEPQYNRAPKWEEGVIENALRVHRIEVARRMGVGISQERFESRDDNHPYNKYVNALEDMRQALGVGDVQGFYDHLMKLPADKMEAYILSQAAHLTPREKAKFDRRFAIAKAILEDKFKP